MSTSSNDERIQVTGPGRWGVVIHGRRAWVSLSIVGVIVCGLAVLWYIAPRKEPNSVRADLATRMHASKAEHEAIMRATVDLTNAVKDMTGEIRGLAEEQQTTNFLTNMMLPADRRLPIRMPRALQDRLMERDRSR